MFRLFGIGSYKPKDAPRHTKLAITEPCQRMWSKVANSVLRGGGKKQDAIRIANGSVLKHLSACLFKPITRDAKVRAKFDIQQGLKALPKNRHRDHKTALCLCGKDSVENLRLISVDHHKEKTREDMSKRRFLVSEVSKRAKKR